MTNTNNEEAPKTNLGLIRWFVREILGVAIAGVILFYSAGTTDWPMAWAMVIILFVWSLAAAILVIPKAPQLLIERATRRKSSETWDTLILSIFGLTSIAKYVLAGLDFRYQWTSPMPTWLPIAALIVTALGYGLVDWAMVANAFFSMVNRIQKERGHSVATGGPYRLVRHPGYVGTILSELGSPLMLGSLWAFLPGLLSALLIIFRTALEDKMLHEQLSGYPEYAKRTRYRLLPGIW